MTDLTARFRPVPLVRPCDFTAVRCDGTGAGLSRPIPCAVCGQATYRYDTVHNQPRHWTCRQKEETNASL